jgi:hydrogenase maturation protein HypF
MQANAVKLLITGAVQGVGLRPTIYRIASTMGLSGWVKNTAGGVEIMLSTSNPNNFLTALQQALPQGAYLESITWENCTLTPVKNYFQILPSNKNQKNSSQIPADSRICNACLSEIFDPHSRFFLYPFTSCAQCGPRYTLINTLPYDRFNTSMAKFKFCFTCLKEYNDPNSRRYHAETSSCPQCGPSFFATYPAIINPAKLGYAKPHGDNQLQQAATYIQAGKIVALKAIGGYILIADPYNEQAIATLRARKQRKAKPFALMALNTRSIQHNFATVSVSEANLLESPAAPIVILKQKPNGLSKNIAPGLNRLGFMLAYNPIFYLLFYYLLDKPTQNSWLLKPHKLALLVTSANLSGGSIIADDKQAITHLKTIADYIIAHNREIVMPCDDSVAMLIGNKQTLIRRSRGYAPKPYPLSCTLPEVLALGGHLKNTICYIRDNQAYLSQYLGTMDNPDSINYLHKVIHHYKKIFDFKPNLIISDLHPDFYSTELAPSFGIDYIQLQHHHAHLCAVVAATNNISNQSAQEPILGCILDGYGYGLQGEALGGELILIDQTTLSFTTLAQLPLLTVPGGDIAEKEPWRIAIGICVDYALAIPNYLLQAPQAMHLSKLIQQKFFLRSTSLGRLFSGIAALLNITLSSDYEAQPALLMESLVTNPCVDLTTICFKPDGTPDFAPLIHKIYQIGVNKGNTHHAVNVFYGSLAVLVEQWIVFHASLWGVKQIALSGGCWHSRYLLHWLQKKFQDSPFKLLIPPNLPCGDECISLGQAWYGAMHLKSSNLNMLQQASCV